MQFGIPCHAVITCHAMTYVISFQVTSWHTSCHVMSWHITHDICRVMSLHVVMTCHVTSWHRSCQIIELTALWRTHCNGLCERNVMSFHNQSQSAVRKNINKREITGVTCTVYKVLHGWSRGQKNEQQNNAPNAIKQCSCRLSGSSERCRPTEITKYFRQWIENSSIK